MLVKGLFDKTKHTMDGYRRKVLLLHEMSLMSEIIQLVTEDAEKRGFNQVVSIEVIVGEHSNVLTEALQFAFQYFQGQQSYIINKYTNLDITHEEAKVRCQNCKMEFHPNDVKALCPDCKLSNCLLISGEAFRVISYEGREIPHENHFY